MVIIGIDSGLDGAVAIVGDTRSEGRAPIDIWDTPTLTIKKGKKNKREYDLAAMAKILDIDRVHIAAVYLERQQAYPKQGGVSNFSTGLGYGIWLGLITGLGLPFETVHPKTWQKTFSISGKGDGTKKMGYQVASRLYPPTLYPHMSLKGPRGGIKDGRCDSLLIATWGKRIYRGKR